MPDAVWSVNRSLPNLSRANDYLPVLTPFLCFRHFFSGSLSLISLIHTWFFSQNLFLNAHHNGSLPKQLKVVWNRCLYIDPERPYSHLLCSLVAHYHQHISQIPWLSVAAPSNCQTLHAGKDWPIAGWLLHPVASPSCVLCLSLR